MTIEEVYQRVLESEKKMLGYITEQGVQVEKAMCATFRFNLETSAFQRAVFAEIAGMSPDPSSVMERVMVTARSGYEAALNRLEDVNPELAAKIANAELLQSLFRDQF